MPSVSLLFDHAIAQFDLASASRYTPAADELRVQDSKVPLGPITAFAAKHPALNYPEDPTYTCLPLHEEASAQPADTFLLYNDDEFRGEIIVYGDGDGGRDWMSLPKFAQTPLARRLRFWHADYHPPQYPPAYDFPVDDREPPRRSLDPEQLRDGLIEHIEAERATQREANVQRANTTTPQELYDRDASAIPTLTYQGLEEEGHTFRVELPASLRDRRQQDWSYFVPEEYGIHQGNEVMLHDADGAPQAEATVSNIDNLTVQLAIDFQTATSRRGLETRLSSESHWGLSLLLNPVPFDREIAAVNTLAEQPFFDILAGQQSITFATDQAATHDSRDGALNQGQQLAAQLALLADDLFCIHGPPGTGKTRTLIEIIRRAVDAGDRVLVTADSNQAVDNLVVGESQPDAPDPASLHPYAQHGREEFVLDRANPGRSQRPLVTDCYRDVDAPPDVVAVTANSAAELGSQDFDLLVFDEATQATATASCIPLTKADRVVLAGDHKQLPPFSAQETPPESAYGMSLFEHLYAADGVFADVGVQLQTQYRMHRDIAHFPNQLFYDGRLRSGRDITPLSTMDAPVEAFNVGGTVHTEEHSRWNETEITLITHLVDDLLADLAPKEIGVITPYRAQARRLETQLADQFASGEAIAVDTIDAFQGSERTAILISLVRSNSDGAIGFLGRDPDGPRRLNVALTRAQRYCAIIGDFYTLRDDRAQKSTTLYQQLFDYLSDTGRMRHVDPDFL